MGIVQPVSQQFPPFSRSSHYSGDSRDGAEPDAALALPHSLTLLLPRPSASNRLPATLPWV